MIEINNLTKKQLDLAFFKKATRKILRGEGISLKGVEISIAFVNEKRMVELNRKYRKRNRPTDVLAFSDKEWREIIICPDQVRENTKKLGLVFGKELVNVLIHGVLHILGYNHEKSEKAAIEMEKIQNYYLGIFFKKGF
ncbi:MAG: rRNA maturation RNase YbeY [Candidatus Nealsonbacteria bacterium CG_4_10_14_0_2_um_filter_38_17]|uniref:Endoribonuclease YbeY n=2 Tax=Candidatus Nealsoniibacteriota TaxID=1817911 RepID=A0A2M7UYN7_9BACT|nr:MAG: rRNA maturation RNase YbeY [Candidatus Nealsonbacteria bacterium CG23_combo_of_CG06-09_8_20_14_all_38_19]PIZ89083.1 MAG: rRNA maturation RNase YbeY [Candidatus Nealsonbacteria bacterium CG_4_10_14_0_2_um_filter_38_17]